MSKRFAALLAGGLFAACEVPVTLEFPVGPLQFEVSTDDLMVPAELDDGSGSMTSVPCRSGQCPLSHPESPLVLACDEDTCDPDPHCFRLDLPATDLGSWGDLQALGEHITRAEVERLTYEVALNTLNVDLPALTLSWGPETAATVDDPSVLSLGEIRSLAAGAILGGTAVMDPYGQAALADHFAQTSTSFRLFAQTSVDLEPGMSIPLGTVQVLVTIGVHLEGGGGS